MTMKRLTGVVICGTIIWCGGAWGGGPPSLESGRQLFTSEKLGTSGRSCATCHPGGKKLKKAAGYDEADLADIINRCIAGPLEGEPLDPGSADMKSLVLYVKSLGGTGK
jgi:cytochrome c